MAQGINSPSLRLLGGAGMSRHKIVTMVVDAIVHQYSDYCSVGPVFLGTTLAHHNTTENAQSSGEIVHQNLTSKSMENCNCLSGTICCSSQSHIGYLVPVYRDAEQWVNVWDYS